DVGEYGAGPAKHVFFQDHAVVDRDIVLNLAVVADHCAVSDENVLAYRHVLPDLRACANVGKMPDAGAFADLSTCVDDGAGVYGVGHEISNLSSLNQGRDAGFRQEQIVLGKKRVAFTALCSDGCIANVCHRLDGAAV